MDIIRIPSAYHSQLSYLTKEDTDYVFKTLFSIATGSCNSVEASLRGGLVQSIRREAVQMENKARARKGLKRLDEAIATVTADSVSAHSGATKSKQIKSKQIKSIQLSSKDEEQSSDDVKEDKRDFDIDLVIEALKNINGGIIDDKATTHRKWGKLIKDKINKIKGFDKFNGTIGDFILYLYDNSDEYKKHHFVGLEKFYYNLASIVSSLKKQVEKSQNFSIKVY